jgi:hypothetical protein
MKAGQPVPTPRCFVPDNGLKTVDLPPLGCGYLSPTDVHMIIAGLPAGTTIKLGAEHLDFINVVRTPGGSLGGEREDFDSSLLMQLTGTGSLLGFNRSIKMTPHCQTDVGPQTPGKHLQSFDTDMYALQGQIIGDPDFDLLRITAGSGFGMPSPGHTTLTRLTSGDWSVDSFFDIEYRIDFIGAPGGPLAGMSGSTTSTERYRAGDFGKVAVDPSGGLPLSLGPATPNPSNERTTLSLALSERSRVRAAVYDVSGRQLAMLSDEELAAGQHTLAWNGLDSAGRRAPAGLYFVRVIVGGREIARRVALRF